MLRRLRQLAAAENALLAMGGRPPPREPIKPPTFGGMPDQFTAEGNRKRSRSANIVREVVRRLKLGKCKSRSPTKAEIVAMSSDLEIDPEGRGITKNVFRTNQECLDILIAACLPFDAEKRRQTTMPSWAVRTLRDDLEDLVMATEENRDQLTRELMAVNELLIGPQVASIRKEVVRQKAQRMVALVQ